MTNQANTITASVRGLRRLLAALAGVMTLSAGVALACPFCSAPSLTLTEQVAQSEAALLAGWAGGKPAKEDDAGTTRYRVLDVAVQSKDWPIKTDESISLPRYRAGKEGDLALLLGIRGASSIDWNSPLEVTRDSYAYIKEAPRPEEPTTERLKYFLKYLENPDEAVATDAYGEFANAPYGDITPLSKEFPRDELRKWVASDKTSPSRLGLYGLMLGLCGKPEDASIMEERIFKTGDEFRLGVDGIMGGYLLLTGEDGLKKLTDRKLIDKSVPFSETYAAMQALRFMWQYGDGRIPAENLKASMRTLLDRPELADLVIADLARMQDWSVQDSLMSLYGKEEYDIPSIKRAIVRFLLASQKAGAAAEGKPAAEHAAQAEKLLAQIESSDPKTVRDAKRFYLITK